VQLFRVRLVDVLKHLDVSLSGHDGAKDRRLAVANLFVRARQSAHGGAPGRLRLSVDRHLKIPDVRRADARCRSRWM